MKEESVLEKARRTRQLEHRLRPELRLKTLDQVRDFIHSKGLVSMLGGNELPSLVSAILGREWKPSGKGFSAWLDWWSVRVSGRDAGHLMMDIPRMNDILGMKIFRKTKTFVAESLWMTLDPLIRRYEEIVEKRKIFSQSEWKILEALEEKGPTRTDRLRELLKLEGKQHTSSFHRALTNLEGFGLIVGYEDPNPERHLHASIWQTWRERVRPRLRRKTIPAYNEALANLIEKTLDAAVMASEKEVLEWFKWDGGLVEAKEKLVDTHKAVRAGSFLVTARIATKLGT